jgi:hypothetical protein
MKHTKSMMSMKNKKTLGYFFKPSISSLYDHDAANLDILQTDSCGVEP